MEESSPPTTNLPLEEIEALRREIADLFMVYDTSLDQPEPGYVRFRGRFLVDTAVYFDELRERFERHGFTPLIRQEEDRTALIALPIVFNPPASQWWINLVLFIATILSTLYVGAMYETGDPGLALRSLWLGWKFSASLMLILGAHELGHYFAARYHKVPVSLPYFIPLPTSFSLIGTMGAFIRLKAPVKNRRALLDVGAAGPLAGMIFALPILWYGLATSPVGPLPTGGYMLEGNSILYALSKIVIFGRFLPANGIDVSLNQFAWAGWVGLLVTGLNLIPVGQLDGGHVAYVLFGKKARQFFWPVVLGLALLVIVTGTFMWAVWILLLTVFGRVHAEPLDDVTPLDSRRRWIAIFTLALFVLVFMPVPFTIVLP
ncbi:MAG: site-2 protease family protein [Ardenticatenaceae bacterium]|nr:site-2 protease family protein [Ardenticatenaceae bacterium]MCB9444612.1 site-2 protease family protein [Ardenticatenaceae bacterium]